MWEMTGPLAESYAWNASPESLELIAGGLPGGEQNVDGRHGRGLLVAFSDGHVEKVMNLKMVVLDPKRP